jgi:FtsP/CotA-like multicopper oxidase with cupredoxin domain
VLKLKFTDNLGTFVFHCHILEHEDAAMMGQFQVVP